jgi:hypothetical protein
VAVFGNLLLPLLSRSMNPLYWLFARFHCYILVLKPDAIVEQVPEAAALGVNVFLLAPLVWVLLAAEDVGGFDLGKVAPVAIWLGVCGLTRRHLLQEATVRRALAHYPVKAPTKGGGQAFIAALALVALLLALFPFRQIMRLTQ